MSDDELRLRDIQQQLARAWIARDRAFIEGVLALEWKVIHTDGSILSRAEVLHNAFDEGSLVVETSTVDDVSVRRLVRPEAGRSIRPTDGQRVGAVAESVRQIDPEGVLRAR